MEQGLHILGPFAQRRNRQVHRIQEVIQVVSKCARDHPVNQGLLRGRHDLDVEWSTGAASRLVGAKEMKQGVLEGWCQRIDVLQKDRSRRALVRMRRSRLGGISATEQPRKEPRLGLVPTPNLEKLSTVSRAFSMDQPSRAVASQLRIRHSSSRDVQTGGEFGFLPDFMHGDARCHKRFRCGEAAAALLSNVIRVI